MSVIIPSSPEDRKNIANAIKEISNAMTRAEAERDHIKEILNDLEEKYEMPKKEMRKVARIYHKQNINEIKDEMSDIEDVYEIIK